MNSGFADHFSGHARDYAHARPTYPAELFAWLARSAPDRRLAWDSATGNGQAAVALAPHFERVIATDASRSQLAAATPARRVHFAAATAEDAPLADHSVDLITIAQAAHWFDHARAWREAQRVLRPGGLIAAWCYVLFRFDAAVDAVVDELYGTILGAHWPPGRDHIVTAYRDLPFPFAELGDVPAFEMRHDWSLHEIEGYLRSWSSAQRYRAATGRDAIALVHGDLLRAFGDPDARRTVRWPLFVRAGRAPGSPPADPHRPVR